MESVENKILASLKNAVGVATGPVPEVINIYF